MGWFVARGIFRHGLIAAGAGWLLVAVASAQQPVVPADSAPVDSGMDQAPTDLGVVLRLSEGLFQMHSKTVSRSTPVQDVIVCVCNVGTAHVTGEMTPDIRPKTDGIAMDLAFAGTSTVRTVGRKEAARICSTSILAVEVTTPITFELESGFQSGNSTTRATLTRACRQVQAEVPGLRGHIVRTVANQRIREQECQIRCEIEQATRRRTETEARMEVDQRLKEWNAEVEPLRQLLLAQSWLSEKRDVQYASDEHSLLLYIQKQAAPATDDSAAPDDSPAFLFPPATLPDAVTNGLVDVIIYADESQKPALKGVLALVESVIDEYAADQPIADRLSFATSDGPGWAMLSVSAESEGKMDGGQSGE